MGRIRSTGDASVYSRFGNGSRNGSQQTQVHGLGNDIFPTEAQRLATIGIDNLLRNRLFGQVTDRIGCRQLHFLVNDRGLNVQSSAENEGRSEERRVGKESRSRGSQCHSKEKRVESRSLSEQMMLLEGARC